MIFARNFFYKIPDFHMIFARKMPEFYVIICNNCPKDILSRILGGGDTSPMPMGKSTIRVTLKTKSA